MKKTKTVKESKKMMKKISLRKAALLCLVMFGAVGAHAQQTQTIELDLAKAISIALDENPTIKIADMEIEKQDYVIKETKGNLYPSLTGSGQYTNTIVQQKMSRDGLSFGADNTITGTASLTIPLYAPSVYASLKLNRTQMESAVEAARSSRITLVNEVKKAYYRLLLTEETLAVLYESEKLMKETVDNTQVMFDTGLTSEYDLLTAQVQLSSLQPTITSTKSGIEISKIYLKMLLGIPEKFDIKSTETFDDHLVKNIYGLEYLTTDISGNSELRALDIQARMLQNQLKMINSQRLPTVAAYGSFTVYGNDLQSISFFGGESGGMFDNIDLSKYPNIGPYLPEIGSLLGDFMGSGSTSSPSKGLWWQTPIQAGIQISIPIFSGGKTNQQVRQTRVAMRQLQQQRDYLEEAKKVELRTSINNMYTAQENIKANEQTEVRAQKAYDISKVRYDGGMGTMLELNSAELSLTQSKLNHTQAIYDYLSAQAEYEMTIGKEE